MSRPASAHRRLASLGPRNVAPPCHLAPGPPRRCPRCIQPVADCDRRLTYEPSHLRSSSPRRPAYAQQQVAVLSVSTGTHSALKRAARGALSAPQRHTVQPLITFIDTRPPSARSRGTRTSPC